jgi:FlaA1/EpsC-like NDP-sugar epimerase
LGSQNIKIEDLIKQKPFKISDKKILKLIEGETIFVTGGAGSIGREVVHQLIQFKPNTVVVLDHAETPLHELQLEVEKLQIQFNFQVIICDISHEKKIDFLLKSYQPNIIFHCAAYKHVPMAEKNIDEVVSVNIKGTKILADLSRKYNVDRFIFISSDKAVNPTSIMGATKRVAELYLQYLAEQPNESKTKFIITRFGNVLESNGSIIPLFKKQIQNGGPLTVTHPEATRYFITIKDACKLILESTLIAKGGEVFIFEMGKPVIILDLAKKMIQLSGFTEEEIPIIKIGLRSGEKLSEELFHSQFKVLKTSHKKIMIEEKYDEELNFVEDKIDAIIKSSNQFNLNAILKNIKGLIPEFRVVNS